MCLIICHYILYNIYIYNSGDIMGIGSILSVEDVSDSIGLAWQPCDRCCEALLDTGFRLRQPMPNSPTWLGIAQLFLTLYNVMRRYSEQPILLAIEASATVDMIVT